MSTVTATPAALELIHRLEAEYGAVMFFQPCDRGESSSPLCLQQGEIPLNQYDMKLGEIGDAPFYTDAEQYERWGRPCFLIDTAPGAAEGFSLEGREGVHFVTRTVSSW